MAVPTRRDLGFVLALGLLASGVSSCNGKTAPAPSASASSSSPLVASVPASASGGPKPPVVACRVMQVAGKAGFRHGLKIQKGAALDGKRWLQLEAGATVAVRHARTTREFTLVGPGFVLPCLDGEEDVLLASGTVQTSQGAGVRPGAEVRIGTPFATLTYGDASLDIKVSATKLDATISGGEARATLTPDAGKPPKRLGEKSKKLSVHGKLDAERVKAGVERCEAKAKEAEDQARLVVKPGPGDAGSLGERAAAHVVLRGAARLECYSARAAVVAFGDESTQKELEKRLDQADLQRTRVPTP